MPISRLLNHVPAINDSEHHYALSINTLRHKPLLNGHAPYWLETQVEYYNIVLKSNFFFMIIKIDILLISEAHFNDRNFFRVPHYKTYFTCYPDNGVRGGTAEIIRNNIAHFEIEPSSTDHLQAISVKVKGLDGDLTMSAAYYPPPHKITQNQFAKYFRTIGCKFISDGNFNCKHRVWGSRLITPNTEHH